MNLWIGKHTIVLGWLQRKLNERQFLILASALVGLSAGLAAIVLKTFVHYIHKVATADYDLPFQHYYVFLPLVGLLVVVFYVQRLHHGELQKSTSFILYSIAKKSSLIAPFHMIAHVITSGITIGFGGSSGLEAPIATTGAAFGSNFSRTYKLSYKQRTLLLACGAAAGIAAAFNAPIAGVLFSVEVLLVDVSATAFIPLIIAAAIGALCSHIILQEGILLTFSSQQLFNSDNIPFYFLMAILAGLVSVYHTKTFLWTDSQLDRFKNPYLKAVIGGLLLALLIFLFPPLFGEGYSSIQNLGNLQPQQLIQNSMWKTFIGDEWLLILFMGLIVVMKALATGITLASGGNGGNFAPSLMVGAFLGMTFARICNTTGFVKLPEANFTLVAMAGVMSGVMHAPLTAIFLIAEVTGGYGLMIPLMLVASVSYTVVKILEPRSIDSQKLAKQGEMLEQNRDQKILSSINLTNLVETNFQPVKETASLRDLISVIETSNRNIFPVVTAEEKLIGIIQLDSIRDIMFNQELYDKIVVKELMQKVPTVIQLDESMESVMKKFDETGAWNLPVINDNKYVGFISKSNIFNKYRNQLIERSVH